MQQPDEDQIYCDHIRSALKRYALYLTRDTSRAEDLVQDTYMKVLARSERACDIDSTRSYMMSVMHNVFIDGVRKPETHTGPVPLDDVEPVAVEASQHLKVTCRETMDAMARLPRAHREVLTRHACLGQSYQEIASALGIPMGTVMSRIARARMALCQRMGVGNGLGLLEEG